MTWLVSSINEEISSNYLGYSTAKELWDDVSETYSDLGNQSQVYEITLKLADIVQGDDSVTHYYNKLKRLWQDLDLFSNLEWKSTEDGTQYRNIVDTNRIFKFLSGLNVKLDDVRGRIIGRNPLPPIGEVFAEVRREETMRGVMLGKRPEAATEGTGLQAKQRGADPKGHLKCSYCGKPRHSRETCWKLHGKPAHLKTARPEEAPAVRANAATGQQP
ncbi:hypothetical protein LINPERPRIM_LOCUS19674 [Linum perenne]